MMITELEKESCSREFSFNEISGATESFLEANLGNKYTLEQIARVVGTNRSKLSEEFKKSKGVSVGGWLRRKRLYYACNELIHTDKDLPAISKEVGYSSYGNFATAFKVYFGVTPREYRNSRRKSQLSRCCSAGEGQAD